TPGLAGPDPGGGARGRHRPGADRLGRPGAAGGRATGGVRTPYRAAGGGQHLAEHRRTADRRHAPGGDGAVRLGAGAAAGDRPVRGAPAGRVRRPVMVDRVSVVVPTLGRPSLVRLLAALA